MNLIRTVLKSFAPILRVSSPVEEQPSTLHNLIANMEREYVELCQKPCRSVKDMSRIAEIENDLPSVRRLV